MFTIQFDKTALLCLKSMANKLVSMQHIRVLIQHLIKGFSQRRIALELQLSRNTVKQYVERLLASEMGYVFCHRAEANEIKLKATMK